ncbi:MAG TPA: hypothetical protein VGL91_22690, partial [Acidobacteriota bacterium]
MKIIRKPSDESLGYYRLSLRDSSRVWTFWRDGLRAVSRTIFHRAGDAPRGVSPIAPLRGASRFTAGNVQYPELADS